MDRTDLKGFSTRVTRLGDGYGIRVLLRGRVISESHVHLPTRADATRELKSMLRMVNKCGWDSPMAYASRHRRKNP